MKLSFEERRVLGTLVEKAHTTPEQCPLTLNSLVNGCNQKSCREPLTNFDEEIVMKTIDKLREKGLAIVARSGGSRVDRYRQCFADRLELSKQEAAALAELLLRGEQTDGELRQRASRMVAIDSSEMQEVIRSLANRDVPFVVRTTPPEKKRGVKYDHCLYPESEKRTPEPTPVSEAPAAAAPVESAPRSAPTVAPASSYPPPAAPAADSADVAELREEIEAMRNDMADLLDRVNRIETQLG